MVNFINTGNHGRILSIKISYKSEVIVKDNWAKMITVYLFHDMFTLQKYSYSIISVITNSIFRHNCWFVIFSFMFLFTVACDRYLVEKRWVDSISASFGQKTVDPVVFPLIPNTGYLFRKCMTHFWYIGALIAEKIAAPLHLLLFFPSEEW